MRSYRDFQLAQFRGEKIIETDSRWGAVHNGALVEKTLQQHNAGICRRRHGVSGFNGVQYHSYLRSTHTSVQGERGEVFDDTLRCLDAAGEPVCRQLTPLPDPLAAAAAQAGLNEDETAIACFLDRMQGYLAGGAEVYPLADALQDAYRKRLGQRLMATIRDESGKREVLAASGGEYVIVDCCNDPQKLKAIRHRIQAQMNGLDVSAGKVRKRVRFLERFASWVRKETSDGAA